MRGRPPSRRCCSQCERKHYAKGFCKSCYDKSRPKRDQSGKSTPEESLDRHLKHKYGISLGDMREMLAWQNNRCAICGIAEPTDRWNVDHDHDTGQIRGVLCGTCNRGLGQFLDDPVRLELARDYLLAV